MKSSEEMGRPQRGGRRRMRIIAVACVTFGALTMATAPAFAYVAEAPGAGITLSTSLVSFGPTGAEVCATVTFTSSFIPNTTLSLDVAGVEYFGVAGVAPLAAAPTSVALADSQTLCAPLPLHSGSTASFSWTAEAAGAAPSPFTGNCDGTAARISGGGPVTTKTC